MMTDDVLSKVASELPSIEENLQKAEDLIQALREAGEDVSSQEVEIRDAKRRLMRWKQMLKKRGYSV